MTGPENYREAERLREQAAEWMDADTGWRATLSTEERLARKMADLADAQLHATLALTAAVAESGGLAVTGAMGLPTSWSDALKGGAQ